MNEESLRKIPLSELFDVMVKAVNELLDMHKNHVHVEKTEGKRKEIELIQRVIVAKRAVEVH
jgi:hypothetical protein